jgi:hypothetical protein
VEELEKALDEELATLRATPPDRTEIERARNTIETNMVGALESPGRVADRFNLYNQYLGTPDYLQQDVARYRAVSRRQFRRSRAPTSPRPRGSSCMPSRVSRRLWRRCRRLRRRNRVKVPARSR